mmetsp:Transcript_16928/g.22160  ORF Transcript_16928/g.22160 Transcript_16928/m.22160 type:complete len:138 (+) Transcript_16928:48-461(+)
MVILRDPLDILVSTTVHRHFGHWEGNGHLYASIVRKQIIDSQLGRMDPAFFKCVDYDAYPNLPDDLGEFLNINYQKDSEWTIHETVKKFFHHSAETKEAGSHYEKRVKRLENFPKRKKAYSDLKDALDKLRTLCNHQ